MTDALHTLLDSLPADGPALPLFLRDDDAGWGDDRLLQLLDTTAAAGVAIDLAAIPAAMTPGLAAQLRRRLDATPGLLGLHQHGCTHDNHEPTGRKCEFGPARDTAMQRADLQQGRQRLQQQFGHRLDAFFTPPWNRCAPHTPALLAGLGYAALSRDRTAPPQAALPELPVDVDWTRHHRAGGAAAVGDALCTALRARLAAPENAPPGGTARHGGMGQDAAAPDRTPRHALGLMLHHAVMDGAEFRLLGDLLRRLAGHPRLRCLPMRALLAAPRPAAGPSAIQAA